MEMMLEVAMGMMNMEVDKVAEMVVDMVVDKVADEVAEQSIGLLQQNKCTILLFLDPVQTDEIPKVRICIGFVNS